MSVKNPFVADGRTAAFLAALPYLNFKYQKQAAVAVKLMEIKDIYKYYDAVGAAVAAQNTEGGNEWKRQLVSAVLPYMSQQNQESMKSVMQMMDMTEMMGVFSEEGCENG